MLRGTKLRRFFNEKVQYYYCAFFLIFVRNFAIITGGNMPFVEYDAIKNLLPQSIAGALSDPIKFAEVERQAAELVANTANIPIPEDASDAPKWATLPAVWIISYIATDRFGVTSPELISKVERNYKEALRILTANRQITTTTHSSVGAISGGWR